MYYLTPGSNMKNLPKRLLIFSSDMENITGLSPRQVRRLRQRIKKFYNKNQNEYITVQEFCKFMGLEEALVQDQLMD